jgi:hypothetical protein
MGIEPMNEYCMPQMQMLGTARGVFLAHTVIYKAATNILSKVAELYSHECIDLT